MEKINQRIGVLGGGQLGKMLCQAASTLSINLSILDEHKDFPAGSVCKDFIEGDFNNYDDVIAFCKDKDIITVEIESVNTEALHKIEEEGIKVFPQPRVLDIIKDKGLQKSFYSEHNLPTSDFDLYGNAAEITAAVSNGALSIPFVQKSRKDGYDGRGVFIVKTENDLNKLMDTPSIVESMVSIQKEIAVIVARKEDGSMQTYPAVEMEFHPTANLVEYLKCPANISKEQEREAETLAQAIAEKIGIVGLLAVELFIDQTGQILINEVAPRPHNSGHHTIESCHTSQYQQHLRAILDLPLGSTQMISSAVMINLLGHPDHKGPASYDGLDKALSVTGAHIHIYGKSDTKPYRKMGHATIIAQDVEEARKSANFVKNSLHIISS